MKNHFRRSMVPPARFFGGVGRGGGGRGDGIKGEAQSLDEHEPERGDAVAVALGGLGDAAGELDHKFALLFERRGDRAKLCGAHVRPSALAMAARISSIAWSNVSRSSSDLRTFALIASAICRSPRGSTAFSAANMSGAAAMRRALASSMPSAPKFVL